MDGKEVVSNERSERIKRVSAPGERRNSVPAADTARNQQPLERLSLNDFRRAFGPSFSRQDSRFAVCDSRGDALCEVRDERRSCSRFCGENCKKPAK